MSRNPQFHNDLTLLHKTRATVGHLFPSYYQLPIDAIYGWMSCFLSWHQSPFKNWIDWSNGRKVSCLRKKEQYQSVLNENWACNFSISRLMLWILGYGTSHYTYTFCNTAAVPKFKFLYTRLNIHACCLDLCLCLSTHHDVVVIMLHAHCT